MLIEVDVYSPTTGNAPLAPTAVPFAENLYENVRRLKLRRRPAGAAARQDDYLDRVPRRDRQVIVMKDKPGEVWRRLMTGGIMTCARSIALVVLLGLLALAPTRVDGRESLGTPEARTHFAQGDAAAKAGKHGEAATAFRKAIEIDPDFGEAHQRFIESTRRELMPGSRTPDIPHLRQLYERWARQHPKRAAYRWAIGFLTHDPAKADAFYNEAIKLDPTFARAHASLARNADLRGDWASERRHLAAAVENNPAEPRYLMRYALAHKNSEPARFRELAAGVLKKFPDSGAAAEALYNLAIESAEPERRTYFERLRANYPPDKFGYGSQGMSTFYSELTEPSEALLVARQMAAAFPTSKTWAQRVTLHEAMAAAKTLIAERKFTEALDAMHKTERPRGAHGVSWVLLKAEAAAGAGQLDQVYATLVERMAAEPDGRVQAALLKYGAGLQKTSEQIDADVWRLRDAKAVLAPPFQLPGTRDKKPVQLSDYKGRVVLLAFWFPG